MKRTRVDKLGRIVIPKSMRKSLGIYESSEVCIALDGRTVCITLAEARCALCDTVIEAPNDIPLCDNCINKIKKT